MARQVINNLESAVAVRTKINGNFEELYNLKVNKNHASVSPEYGIASTELFGHIKVNGGNGLSISDGVLSMNNASTSSPGAVQLVNSLTSNDSTKALSAAQGKLLNDSITSLRSNTPLKNHASTSTEYGVATSSAYGHIRVSTGNGLNLSNGTLSMTQASTSSVGAVQLEDNLNSTSSTKALTANMGNYLYNHKAEAHCGTSAPSSSLGRDGDIYLLIES